MLVDLEIPPPFLDLCPTILKILFFHPIFFASVILAFGSESPAAPRARANFHDIFNAIALICRGLVVLLPLLTAILGDSIFQETTQDLEQRLAHSLKSPFQL